MSFGEVQDPSHGGEDPLIAPARASGRDSETLAHSGRLGRAHFATSRIR